MDSRLELFSLQRYVLIASTFVVVLSVLGINIAYAQTADPPKGAIYGNVFEDWNRNGLRDRCEPGIPGVSITIRDNDSRIIYAADTTDLDGNYVFNPFPADRPYIVVESDPTGYVSTTSNLRDVFLPDQGLLTVDFGDMLAPSFYLPAVYGKDFFLFP